MFKSWTLEVEDAAGWREPKVSLRGWVLENVNVDRSGVACRGDLVKAEGVVEGRSNSENQTGIFGWIKKLTLPACLRRSWIC